MRLLDVLVFSLVIFPTLTHSVTVEIPGLAHPMELPDLGVPLLVAGLVAIGVRASRRQLALALAVVAAAAAGLALAAWLWQRWIAEHAHIDFAGALWRFTRSNGIVITVLVIALAVRRWTHEPWEKSACVRLALRLAGAWRAALARSPARALWTAAALIGAGFLWPSLLRHWAFESHGHDLGIFTNAIWNLTHGNGYVSSVKGGINLFADHQSPLFWALAPPFALAPRPETLLAAQAFGLAAGGPALYYLARARFGAEHWASAALPWLYWAYLPLRNANAFDFHPEVFMLPLFLWAFAGFASPARWGKALGVVALAAALGAKESAPVVAVGLGVAWALTGAKRWPGLALAAAGVAVFLFDVKVVPRFFGDDYAYMGLYQRFGGGIADLLLAPFTQPGYFFTQILDRDRLNFLFWTLAPLGFLPLFDWRAALAALPAYLMLFLSEGEQRVRLVFHYGIEPGSALFWALPLGLAAFARRFGWERAAIWMVVWAVAAHGPTDFTRAHGYFRNLHAPWLGQAMACIDPAASTAASGALVPHLATRAWIGYPDQLKQASGEPVGCVVTDLMVNNWPVGRQETRRVLASLPAQGYRQALKCNELTVYELRGTSCLRCQPGCY